MHVMFPEPASQYHSSQPQSTQPNYQLAVSPARQPVKKRRLLSPYQQHNGLQHLQQDNSGYKVSYRTFIFKRHFDGFFFILYILYLSPTWFLKQ